MRNLKEKLLKTLEQRQALKTLSKFLGSSKNSHIDYRYSSTISFIDKDIKYSINGISKTKCYVNISKVKPLPGHTNTYVFEKSLTSFSYDPRRIKNLKVSNF